LWFGPITRKIQTSWNKMFYKKNFSFNEVCKVFNKNDGDDDDDDNAYVYRDDYYKRWT
jgi:hypothetical protein